MNASPLQVVAHHFLSKMATGHSSAKCVQKRYNGLELASQHERGVECSLSLALEPSCGVAAECVALLVDAAGAVSFYVLLCFPCLIFRDVCLCVSAFLTFRVFALSVFAFFRSSVNTSLLKLAEVVVRSLSGGCKKPDWSKKSGPVLVSKSALPDGLEVTVEGVNRRSTRSKSPSLSLREQKQAQ